MFVQIFTKARKFLTNAIAAAALVLLSSALIGSVHAQEKGPMDEKAMQILRSMSDYLGKADSISFRARTFYDEVRESGIKIKAARSGTVLLKRPNQLHVDSVWETGAARATWFDGSKLTIWDRDVNQVKELEFKGTIDALIEHLEDKYEVNLPIADLLFSDIGKALNETIISSEYLGTRTVQDVKVHHLSFESTGADWQIWIEADDTPVPRRFVVTYVIQKGEPQFLAQLDRWSIGGEAEEAAFQAGVPESAKKVAFGK